MKPDPEAPADPDAKAAVPAPATMFKKFVLLIGILVGLGILLGWVPLVAVGLYNYYDTTPQGAPAAAEAALQNATAAATSGGVRVTKEGWMIFGGSCWAFLLCIFLCALHHPFHPSRPRPSKPCYGSRHGPLTALQRPASL